jgi:hypothetical protein
MQWKPSNLVSIRRPYWAVIVSLFIASASYGAQWNVTLDQPSQSGSPGSPIVFSGTITNSTGSDLFLGTGAINFSSAAPFTKDYADDFLSLLGIIPANGYSGPLFFIQWNPGAPAGSSGIGTFVLTVPAPISPSSISVDFGASVASTTTTPELSSVSLTVIGFLLLAVIRGRRMMASNKQPSAGN